MLAKLMRGGGRHEHVVVSLGEIGPIGEELRAVGDRVHALRIGSPRGGITGLPQLVRLIGEESADVLQGWMNHGNLAATLASGLRRRAPPLLWNIRQTLSASYNDRWLTRRIIACNARLSGRPRFIIYNSNLGALEHEAAGYAKEKRRIVPNGFDLNQFQPSATVRAATRKALGVGDDEILIGLVARFDPWKNHEGFAEAAAELISVNAKVRFLFAGGGTSRGDPAFLQLVAEAGIADRSLLLGERSDMPALSAALDIACNVSHGEGFPNAIGEAMACAVPCVVTDVGDCREIVGASGVICRDSRPQTIATAIGSLIDAGPAGRAGLGRLARERIEQHYSLSATVARYDAIYEEAARHAKGR